MKRQLEAVVGSLPAPGLSEQTPPLPLPGCLEPPTFWRLDWQRAGDEADLAKRRAVPTGVSKAKQDSLPFQRTESQRAGEGKAARNEERP